MTDQTELKINSRVLIARSAIPNADSFVGWYGSVVWTYKNREIGVALDNDPLKDPIMFLRRELDLI